MTYVSNEEFRVIGVESFKNNLNKFLDEVYKKQLTLIITRSEDENVVVISEEKFNEIQKGTCLSNTIKYCCFHTFI